MAAPAAMSAAVAQAVDMENKALDEYVSRWPLIARPKDTLAYSVKQGSRLIPAQIPAWSTGNTAAHTMGVGPTQTVTPDGKGLHVVIPRSDYEKDFPGIVQLINGLQLGTLSTLDSVPFILLNSLKTSTYEDGGSSPWPAFIDDGVRLHKTASGATWANNAGGAFAYGTFQVGLSLLGKIKNYADDAKLGLGDGNLSVVCSRLAEADVTTVLKSTGIPFEVSSGVFGTVDNPNALKPVQVVTSHHLVSDTDVFLIDRERTPIILWVPMVPVIMWDWDVKQQAFVVSVTFEVKGYCEVPPQGIVGFVS